MTDATRRTDTDLYEAKPECRPVVDGGVLRRSRFRVSVARWATAILVVIAYVSAVAGQTNTGEIAGVVRDSTGGVLPGATVTARHPASGTVVEQVTDGQGRRFLPSLRIGE